MVKWAKKITEKKDISTAATGSVLHSVTEMAQFSSNVQSNHHDDQTNGMELFALASDNCQKNAKYCNICKPEFNKKDIDIVSSKCIIETTCKSLDPNSKTLQPSSGIINPCDFQVSVKWVIQNCNINAWLIVFY
jgi:hypothetical protein